MWLTSIASPRPLRAADYPLSQFDELRGVIVRDLLEDSQREIWLAADDGLWHNDSGSFKRSNGWGETGSATAVVEDRAGALWIGTPNGVLRLDPFTRAVDPGARLLQGHWVLCLRRDSDGLIWAGTDRGLVRFDPEAPEESVGTIAGTESHQVLCIAVAADGDILAGSHGMLLRIRGTEIVDRESDLPGKRLVRSILEARDGALWIGLRFGGGLVRVHEGRTRWFGVADGLIDPEVNVIVEHPDGSIYIAMENGLCRYVDDGFVQIGEEHGLNNTDLHSLLCDREGNVWLGTYGAGVQLLRSADVLTFDMSDGLRHPLVTGAGRLGDGRLIFATIHGATVFDPSSLRMQNIDPATHLYTAYSTSSGEVLLGGPRGIGRAGDQSLVPIPGEVRCMDEDGQGGLWIGTRRGLYRQSGDQVTPINFPDQAGSRVNTVRSMTDGCLAGTPRGLWQLTGHTWRSILQDHDVRCIMPTARKLWVGTSREVIALDTDYTTVALRFAADDVRDFAQQDDDTVWAATGDGLVCFRAGNTDRYFAVDGLPSNKIRCLEFDSNGYLYAGATQGIVRIQPDRFTPCRTPPTIAVEEVIIGGASFRVSDRPFRVESRNPDVTVQFRTRGVRSAVGVQYQYRLGGAAGDGWSELSSDPSFRGRGLPRGDYTLHARCVNAHGVLSENEIALPFSVHPPAMVAPWLAVTTAVVVVAAAALAGVYRRRRRELIAEREQAEVAMLETEQRLQALLDNTTAVIYMKDREGKYVLINRQYERLFNVTRGEIVGRTDLDIFPRNLAEAFRHNDDLVLQSGRVLEFDEVAPHRDGPHHYLSIKFPVFDASGVARAVCGISTDITERKRMEQSLRDSEKYNRTLFENSPIGLALCRLDGELVDVNEAYSRIVGCTPQELIGRSYWELTPVGYADNERRQLDSLLKSGSYGPYEKYYIHKDGHLVPVRLSGLIMDRDGEKFIWSSVEDITEQRRADAAIRENEKRLRELTAAVPGAVYQFRLGPDGSRSFPFVSDGIQGLLGITPQQVFADAEVMFRHVHPDDLPALERSIVESEADLSDWLQELRILTTTGQEKWIRGNSVPKPMQDGGVLWTGVLVDISPLKHAQEQLRRQALVFENMYDGVILCDHEGRITGWNKGAERMFGYTLDEVRGQSPEMLNRPEDAAATTEQIQSALRRHGQWSGELTFVRKDGAEGVCEAIVVLYRHEKGEPATTISVNRDVTARKLAEQRAQQHQAELARVARFTALGGTAAGIAHELNQPLQALSAYVQGCERRMVQDGRFDADFLKAMGEAVAAASRASQIVNHVRSLIRQEPTSRVPVDVNALVRGITEHAEVRSRSNGVPLRLDLEPAVPMVKVDPIQIEQVILNLVTNAYDAIDPTGRGRNEVAVSTHVTPRGEVAVQIRDSGIGLSTSDFEKPFQPFYTTKKEGLGIGLSISRTIAENHGGKLVAIPTDGRGATFQLTLPPMKGDAKDES